MSLPPLLLLLCSAKKECNRNLHRLCRNIIVVYLELKVRYKCFFHFSPEVFRNFIWHIFSDVFCILYLKYFLKVLCTALLTARWTTTANRQTKKQETRLVAILQDNPGEPVPDQTKDCFHRHYAPISISYQTLPLPTIHCIRRARILTFEIRLRVTSWPPSKFS